MVKQDQKIEVEGVIEEALPDTTFKVRLKDQRLVTAYLGGKLRLYHIRVMPGDQVKVVMTPYDQSQGRIVYRIG